MLQQFEKQGIYSLLINAALPEDLLEELGQPREFFSHWLGHIYPDDIAVGYGQAKALLRYANARRVFSPSQPMALVAMSGGRDSQVAFDRNAGLQRFLDEHPQVQLQQLVFTHWRGETARKQVGLLLKRYPNVDVFWNVSDEVALGTLLGLQDSAIEAGEQVFVAGIDWSPRALTEIGQGRMALSMGGHFLEGAQALLQAYDHYHGVDFADYRALVQRTQLEALNQRDIRQYLESFSDARLREIDFSVFSFFHMGSATLGLNVNNVYQLSH